MSPPSTSDPTPSETPGEDAVDRLADELLQDPDLFAEPNSDAVPDGGLTWIRSTLRAGGDADDSLVGSLFHDKYRILRKIGTGGFGAVYEALDERGAHNRVALKIMLPDLMRSESPLEIFRGEAVRVTRLNHPNIVDWKNFDRTPDGIYYFVMELLEGEDLQAVLKREGVLEWRRALRILLQILGALRAAHFVGEGQSILHLDLKPKNILLLPERRSRVETAKVIDFGIGQYLGGEELAPIQDTGLPPPVPAVHPDTAGAKEFATVTSRSESTRHFERRAAAYPFKISQACTPEYASPEQCVHIEFADGAEREPRQLDGRADLYSFGIIAYQLLTGRLPFQKPTHRSQYLDLHQRAPIEPWGTSESVVPRRLRQFVERCLEKDADARWKDAQEAHEELERIARPSAGIRTVAAAVALLLVGAWLGGFFAAAPATNASLEPHEAHLCPSSSTFSARLLDSDSRTPLELHDQVQLLDAAGSPLEGWTVEPSPDGSELLLSPDRAWVQAHPGRVVLEGLEVVDPTETWKTTTDLRLVWLGPSTWTHEFGVSGEPVPQVASGGLPSELLQVDPNGLRFELFLPQLEQGDLDLKASRGGLGNRELEFTEQSGTAGGLLLSCRLEGFEDGPHVLRFQLANNAEERRSFELPMAVRTTGPEFTTHARTALEHRSAWTSGQPLVLERGDPADLLVQCEAEATLDCQALAIEGLQLIPGRASRLGLGPVLEEVPAGQVTDLELIVRDRVLSSAGRAPVHQTRRQLQVQVIEDTEVRVSLQSPTREGGSRALAYTSRIVQPVVYGAEDLLVLRIETENPLGTFDLELDLHGTAGEPIEGVQPVLLTPQTKLHRVREGLTAFGPRLDDGDYVLHVEALRRGSRRTPIDSHELPFQVDTRSPEVALGDKLQQSLVLTEARTPFSHAIPVPTSEEGGVSLAYRVTQDGNLIANWRPAPIDSPPVGEGLWWTIEHDERLPDGTYLLDLRAEDLAGNRQSLPTLEFEVARRGPQLALESPPDYSGEPIRWPQRNKQLVPIELRAADPNRVVQVTCHIVRSPEFLPRTTRPPLESMNILEELDPTGEAGAPSTDAEWRWAFDPGLRWSLATDVYICIEAVDAQGARSRENFGPYALGLISRTWPPRRENMWLVEIDTEREYSFRGRNPLDENESFAEAGLPQIWVGEGEAKAGESESAWDVRIPAERLRPYYLDERPVTVADYLRFMENEEHGYLWAGNWAAGRFPGRARYEQLRSALLGLDPHTRVTDVSHTEAQAYALALDKRLPSLLELEYAARGGELYRAWSWDALDDTSRDTAHWTRRIHGLSHQAEWTSTPAGWEGPLAPPRPWSGAQVSCELFLAPDGKASGSVREYWIRGSLAGTGSLASTNLRRDFAAIDAAPANWSSSRVGFRCAQDTEQHPVLTDPRGAEE